MPKQRFNHKFNPLKKLYFLALLSIYCFSSSSQNLGFVPMPDYPGLGRDDASVFVIGNKAYVGIGYMSGFVLGQDFYCFDSNTNTWQAVAQFPGEPRMYATSFTLNGNGYVVGGIGANNTVYTDVWQYNPSNNSWAQLPTSLPGTLRRGMQAAIWNDHAYMFFGKDTYNLHKQVWKFDGSIWSQLPDFPSIARFQSADVQVDSMVYFVGGFDLSIRTQEVWRFNLQTESWTQLADFPGEDRWYARGFVFNHKIYIGTGWAEAGYVDDFWSYEPVSQNWETAPALAGEYRKGMVSFNIGERAFIGSGTKITGERDPKFWEFVTNAGITQNENVQFSLYPNPAKDYLYIGTAENSWKCPTYKVVDINGKEIKKGQLQTSDGMIAISGIPDGIYHLVITNNGASYTQKFCVQRQ